MKFTFRSLTLYSYFVYTYIYSSYKIAISGTVSSSIVVMSVRSDSESCYEVESVCEENLSAAGEYEDSKYNNITSYTCHTLNNISWNCAYVFLR